MKIKHQNGGRSPNTQSDTRWKNIKPLGWDGKLRVSVDNISSNLVFHHPPYTPYQFNIAHDLTPREIFPKKIIISLLDVRIYAAIPFFRVEDKKKIASTDAL